MDSHKNHKAFIQMGPRATMSAVVRLVHVRFPPATYVKDILLQSTKTKNQSLQIIQLGPTEAQE